MACDHEVALLSAMRRFCDQYGTERTYWVAYSGGLDSHVLLSLCVTLRTQYPLSLRAIHVNHGWSPSARYWAEHCRRVCQAAAVDYLERMIDQPWPTGNSLEAIARERRYAIFANELQTGDILLTAHQQNDQAETVLLQLFRGASLKGLAAMPIMKPFGRGWHGRPLLSFSRALLQQYAEEQPLQWIQDESNLDLTFARNFLRCQIFPLLQVHWPHLVDTLSRSATHCAAYQQLLDEVTAAQYEQVKGSNAYTLSVKKLLQLDPAWLGLVLRYWIQQHGYRLPGRKKITAIQQQVLTARPDRMPLVQWGTTQIRRYRDQLYLSVQRLLPPVNQGLTWCMTQPLAIPRLGVLQALPVKGRGLRQLAQSVSVQFRQPGEKVYLPSRQERRTLKNLFQEWCVPPWERHHTPLLFIDDRLISMVGYFIDPHYVAAADEMGWDIQLAS